MWENRRGPGLRVGRRENHLVDRDPEEITSNQGLRGDGQ